MSLPIRINRSAESFSLRALQDWLIALQDAQYDPEWIEALEYFTEDTDSVLMLTGQPLERAIARAANTTATERQMAAHTVRRYLGQISRLTGERAPRIRTELQGETIWVWHTRPNLGKSVEYGKGQKA